MIKVSFSVEENRVCGFDISGHSGYAEAGSDIVCAAVSSAAYMTANTVTDVICSKADVSCEENRLFLLLKDKNEASLKVLEGFRLHIEQLEEQYPDNIRIITEV